MKGFNKEDIREIKRYERVIKRWWENEDLPAKENPLVFNKGHYNVVVTYANAGFQVYCDIMDDFSPLMHCGEGIDYDDVAKLVATCEV